jgi:glyoxylase-like metal-dependent hydrolase (beta-lactamase superfamily II)
VKIRDGLHRLGNGTVNAYLVEEAGEITVVDTGLPGYWKLLPAELAAMGRSLRDIRAVVLTHGHSDHLGFAEGARRDLAVPVSVHEADALLARGKVKNPAEGTGPVRPLPLLRFIALAMRWGGWHIARLGTVSTFGDGATLDVPGSPRVILAPGHTPGSAALHVPARDALLIGDVFATYAVTTGRTGPRLAPFTADRTEALASLDRIAGVEAGWVLPGHGEPWTGGVSEAIRQTRLSEAG